MIDIATVEKYDRINELTMLLNYYRDQYYNYAKSEISDYEYDVSLALSRSRMEIGK